MNRRRFLKYASATAAVVGASALGLNYVSRQSPSTASPTSTTMTSELTSTSVFSSTSTQAVQLASLNGRLFFNYNGNGVQDATEPAIAGALVQLKNETGTIIAQAVTDSSGDYSLEDVRAGTYKLHLGVDQFSDKRLTYMCTSPDEFRAVSDDYHVSLKEDSSLNIGLMEGFLTMPFLTETRFSIGRYYDWDPTPATSLWWNGRRGDDPNNHIGIDYDMKEGQKIVASAPGEVSYVGKDTRGQFLVLRHGNFFTDYGHVSEFLAHLGQQISRGQLIAKSGRTFGTYPHLHFQVAQGSSGPGNKLLDPYQPLFEMKPAFNGYWSFTDAGGWTWAAFDSRDNPNLTNYWTKNNDPQFPATQLS